MVPSPAPPQRVYAIVRWRKTGHLRFLGHLDVARTIERAVRRAGLPVVYSRGFSPTAQMSFSSALPVGVAGENEICAVELERRLPDDEVRRRLEAQLPDDLGIVDVQVVTRPGRKPYPAPTVAEYRVQLWPEPGVTPELLRGAAGRLLAAQQLPVVRESKSRTRELDIRPGLHALSVLQPEDPGDGCELVMALACDPEGLVKPVEVLELLVREFERSSGAATDLQPRCVTRLGLY